MGGAVLVSVLNGSSRLVTVRILETPFKLTSEGTPFE
jgi:hypothetical protein